MPKKRGRQKRKGESGSGPPRKRGRQKKAVDNPVNFVNASSRDAEPTSMTILEARKAIAGAAITEKEQKAIMNAFPQLREGLDGRRKRKKK